MTIKEAQQQVDQWISTYGVRYFHPMTNMAILMEEMGELARWMAREYGEQSYKSSEDQTKAPEAIASEMADILWVLLCLANQSGVDLETALKMSILKKTERDQSRHMENPKLQSPSSH